MHRYIHSYAPIVLFVAGGMVVFAGLVYLALTAGVRHDARSLPVAELLITPRPPQTSSQPYPPLDPASSAGLDQPVPTGTRMLPLGMYVPRVPDLRPTSTVTPPPPTLTATATATQMPTAASQSSIPTRTPTREIILPAVPPAMLANIMRPPPTADPLVDCAPDDAMPMVGRLVQRFHGSHSGIDLSAPTGTPILTTHSGTVKSAGWDPYGYGILVVIENGPYITYYAHQSEVNVSEGDFVRRGAIIGFSGNTGNSSGPHLHYETRIDNVPVDPLTFAARGYRTC